MTTELLTVFAQFGFAGIILAVLIWQLRISSAERRDMHVHHHDHIGKIVSVVDRNSEAMRDIKEVLASFKEIVRQHTSQHNK